MFFRSSFMKRSRESSTTATSTPVKHWWETKDDGSFVFPIIGSKDLSCEMSNPSKAPSNWKEQWDGIFRERGRSISGPVDTMGCERLYDADASPKTRRFQILVSLLLSPQSKDEKTAESMQNLKAIGLTPQKIVSMTQEELEPLIKPSGLYRGKAKSLLATSKMLIEKFDGDVPNNLQDMLSLAGVGPKIANLALGACWGLDVGIGCDVHVTRITNRLGWTKVRYQMCLLLSSFCNTLCSGEDFGR